MKEVDASQSKRAAAFELWMNAPMPMVTLLKTLDVTNLVRLSRKHRCKFNMLICWCIGKAASQIEEFYLLPAGQKLEPVFITGECRMGEGFCRSARQKIAGILDVFPDFLTRQNGKRPAQAAFNGCEYRFLLQYDHIAVNIVVAAQDGSINTCDIPFSEDLQRFHQDYQKFTGQVHISCQTHDLSDEYMVIGTSALTQCELDGAVNIYAGFYNNPFMIWGKYKKGCFKTTLPVSFQFHHTQMDGAHAAQFLENLQKEIRNLKL